MGNARPRVYDLSPACPEGWFEEVLRRSPDFERASQIIGRSTLGLGLIAGARIASLTPSAQSQNLTTVEFSIGTNEELKQVPLSEFRQTIAQYLLAPLENTPLPDDPDVEALQAHIGGRYMLEATLFQVRPLELRHDLGLSEIALEFNDIRHVLALEDFRDIIDDRVRSELGLQPNEEEVAIDLDLVDRAEEANAQGNWNSTVALLTPWLGPISMLLRTGEANSLGHEVHGRLSDGLDLLGRAYAAIGQLDAANEVLRLGVQWAGESSKAGDLFFTLGRASVAAQKHGEAIGLLRRAIRLGIDEREAMPLLARSLAARDQCLAAMVCVQRALGLGAEGPELDALREELHVSFGGTWEDLQRWMSDAE